MTIYSKEMKTKMRGVEDTIKENRHEWMLLGGDFNERIEERGPRNWEEEMADGKENPRTRCKMQKRLMKWIEENG
jgi:hypothetical protein